MDVGSRFIITLPLLQEEPAAHQPVDGVVTTYNTSEVHQSHTTVTKTVRTIVEEEGDGAQIVKTVRTVVTTSDAPPPAPNDNSNETSV